jgi:hypothetical protein
LEKLVTISWYCKSSFEKHEPILEKIQIVEQNHDEMLNNILIFDKKIDSLLENK